MKIKLQIKRLYETDSVIYLEIKIGKSLKWKQQINHVAVTVNKANVMPSKLRHDLDTKNSKISLLGNI